ncbi:MAG: hypothetical protein HY072_03490 [Deltaproteobacteria bacterium]|nr:hypothetical protein [Deltaproteobacteria bacterium]
MINLLIKIKLFLVIFLVICGAILCLSCWADDFPGTPLKETVLVSTLMPKINGINFLATYEYLYINMDAVRFVFRGDNGGWRNTGWDKVTDEGEDSCVKHRYRNPGNYELQYEEEISCIKKQVEIISKALNNKKILFKYIVLHFRTTDYTNNDGMMHTGTAYDYGDCEEFTFDYRAKSGLLIESIDGENNTLRVFAALDRELKCYLNENLSAVLPDASAPTVSPVEEIKSNGPDTD